MTRQSLLGFRNSLSALTRAQVRTTCVACGSPIDPNHWVQAQPCAPLPLDSPQKPHRTIHCACGQRAYLNNRAMTPTHNTLLRIRTGNPHSLTPTWYHATTNPRWFETLQHATTTTNAPLVHIGYQVTALDVASQLARSGQPVYLFQVHLQDSLRSARRCVEDDNEWPVTETDDTPHGTTNHLASLRAQCRDDEALAFPYVNNSEAPGSMSILVSARHIVQTTLVVGHSASSLTRR